jgi:hypothetical protein
MICDVSAMGLYALIKKTIYVGTSVCFALQTKILKYCLLKYYDYSMLTKMQNFTFAFHKNKLTVRKIANKYI